MTINHLYLETTVHPGYGQFFSVDRVLYENHTEHQHLIIFENALCGRVMALDGIIQTTENDEFIYHEMLAHVPILAHGEASRVLIIGGGDGGMLREVVKHATVQRVVQVEIDNTVVELCKQYLPRHSAGAFDDPRLDLVIDDGLAFLAGGEERFDVIISDSTDPVGPGEVLFSRDFYRLCQERLAPGGVLVTQNGVAYIQRQEFINTHRRRQAVFADASYYGAAVPTYVGGLMAFGWGTDNPTLRQVPLATLEARFQQAGIKTHYYTPAVHQGAFALPAYLLAALHEGN